MKRKIVTGIIAILSLYCVAANLALADGGHTKTHAKKITVIRQKGMICSVSNGSIKIKLPDNHGGQLAVIDPDNNMLEVAVEDDLKIKDIIPSSVFIERKEITINLSRIKGVNFSIRPASATPIFKDKGIYEFQVSKEFAVDVPDLDGWCDILFIPK